VTIQAEQSADCDPVDTVPVEWLEDGEMVPELQRLHRLKARAEAREAAVIARAHRRGVPQAQGFASPTAWLIVTTGEPPAVCRSRVRVALALQHMDHTRRAFAAGDLSECRVRLLVDARAGAPDLFRRDEPPLVEQARTLPARAFPPALAHWRRLADPDGARFDAEAAFLARRLHISSTWGGRVRLDGDLDPESGQIVLTAIRSLAEPAALDPDDRRSPEQRRADALVEISRRHLDSADRPAQGGERPHITLTLSPSDLAGDSLVDLEAGPITAEAARRLACDASISHILVDHEGMPLAAREARRVVPPALRRALDLRDGHCTHPGCDVPARWCDAHHIIHWAHGGKTQLANLRLLCRKHHRLQHDEQQHPRRE
jgi:hypothetical protein